jgi:hypothetical protein
MQLLKHLKAFLNFISGFSFHEKQQKLFSDRLLEFKLANKN